MTAAIAATKSAMTISKIVGTLPFLFWVGAVVLSEDALELGALLDETTGALLDEEEDVEDEDELLSEEEELLEEAAFTGRNVTVSECGPDTFSNV